MARNQRETFTSVEDYCKALGGEKPIGRLLIANNGNAAMKVIKSLRSECLKLFRNENAIELVGMATPDDVVSNAEYISRCDFLVKTPGGPSSANLGNLALLRQTALEWNCDALWPGWGHASEDYRLPKVLRNTRCKWVGPPPDAMEALGCKVGSSLIAQTVGVPVVPWSGSHVKLATVKLAPVTSTTAIGGGLHPTLPSGGITGELTGDPRDLGEAPASPLQVTEREKEKSAIRSPQELFDLVDRGLLDLPFMIKAAAGGGGKGIRVVRALEEIESAYFQVANEVKNSLIFAMKLLSNCRHLEVQVIGDNYGNIISLGTRDCTIQRRHQKIIEEGPPVAASAQTLSAMETAAVKLCKSVGYTNAGTVEFLFDPTTQEFFFLEVNARLQVEHVVTEMLIDVNLPWTQIAVAMGIRLFDLPEIRRYLATRQHTHTLSHTHTLPHTLSHTLSHTLNSRPDDQVVGQTVKKLDKETASLPPSNALSSTSPSSITAHPNSSEPLISVSSSNSNTHSNSSLNFSGAGDAEGGVVGPPETSGSDFQVQCRFSVGGGGASRHVMTARVTAEDAEKSFQPTSGDIQELSFESSPNVWAYFSVGSNAKIHQYSDSQFGHIFASGPDRESARITLLSALKSLIVRGEISTNIEALQKILEHPDFIANQTSTTWLEAALLRKPPAANSASSSSGTASYAGGTGGSGGETGAETCHGAPGSFEEGFKSCLADISERDRERGAKEGGKEEGEAQQSMADPLLIGHEILSASEAEKKQVKILTALIFAAVYRSSKFFAAEEGHFLNRIQQGQVPSSPATSFESEFVFEERIKFQVGCFLKSATEIKVVLNGSEAVCEFYALNAEQRSAGGGGNRSLADGAGGGAGAGAAGMVGGGGGGGTGRAGGGDTSGTGTRTLKTGWYFISGGLDGRHRRVCFRDDEKNETLGVTFNGTTYKFTAERDPSQLRAPVSGKLARWLVPNGGYLSPATPYAEVEIMKLYIQLASEVSGYLSHVLTEGAIFAVGDTLGTLKLPPNKKVFKPSIFNGVFPTPISGKTSRGGCGASLNRNGNGNRGGERSGNQTGLGIGTRSGARNAEAKTARPVNVPRPNGVQAPLSVETTTSATS